MDHNDLGLYFEGPQPAEPYLRKRIGTSTAQADPLPPEVARVVLNRSMQYAIRLKRILQRARAMQCR